MTATAPPPAALSHPDLPRPASARRAFPPAFLARLALIAVLVVAAAVASALVISSRAETVYGARAEVVYVPGQGSADDARQRDLNTQRELILSRSVLAPVAQAAQAPLPELRDATEVELELDNVVRITVADEDPERARSLAGAIQRRYLSVARGVLPETRRAQELVERELAQARAEVRTAPDEFVFAFRDRVNRLRDRLLELRVEGVQLAEPRALGSAYVLDDPLSPRPVRAAAAGGVVGLLLATGVVVLLARRRWRAAQGR